MKITQISNGLEFKSGAAGQVIFGILFCVAGLATAGAYIFVLTGSSKSPLLLLFAAGFAGIGILCLFVAKSRRVIIQSGNQIAIMDKRVFGGSKLQTVPVAEIDHVELRHGILAGGSGRTNVPNISASLGIVTKTGSFVELATDSQNTAYVGAGPLTVTMPVGSIPMNREGEQIAQYLQLPFSVTAGPSLQDGIAAVMQAANDRPSQPSGATIEPQQPPVINQPVAPMPTVMPDASAANDTAARNEDQNVG